jgi:hypothetical protein
VADAPRARPFNVSRFGTGTRRTPVPFGMKAKVNPASQRWAVRIALGMEIWNFEDKVVVSAISYFLYIDGQRVRNFAVYARALGSLIIACLNLERLGELGSIVEPKAFENSLSCISKGI